MRLNKILVAFLVLLLSGCNLSEPDIKEEKNDKNYQIMQKAGLDDEEIAKYLSYDYFDINKLERYLEYDAKTIKDKIIKVNMNLDLKPYEDITYIEKESDNELVNKYNSLKPDYVPDDLVEIESVCINGSDYGCWGEGNLLRKDAAEAFEEWSNASQKAGYTLKAISGYRSYGYQENLYNNALNTGGREYADAYFARPGMSEHNTGLAVDITFNDYNFNEIENCDGYEWFVENAYKYGFILRYPSDKTDETLYNYESWHFRYVGKKLAKKLYKSRETLEYYKATH